MEEPGGGDAAVVCWNRRQAASAAAAVEGLDRHRTTHSHNVQNILETASSKWMMRPPRSPDELFNRRPILTNVSGGDRILFNTKLLAEGFNRLTSQCMCWTVKQRRQGWNPCYCIHLIQDFCPLPPLANKAISTQYWSSQHYWEDQKTRERTDHSPSMPRLRKEVARLIQGLLRGCSSVLLSICRERYQNYKTNVIKQKIESSFNRR